MKLNLKHLSIRSTDSLDSLVKDRILALGDARQIDEASIQLVRHAHESPAFEVKIHLVTPGPDIFAEARDHTIRAAFEKAMLQVNKAVANRAAKPAERARTRLSAPAIGRGHPSLPASSAR